ncbi:hypothetical protein FB593_11617 [Rhizobium sp. SJZ105]|uniref:GNAT family N-acetyltransferase n=1 Tax=Rhizobium sp. SJZ105 TaxID=2572678 RepID=UPI0011A14A17|nr:GNAT family N-acetyltransferase [Rhizobium sp. SJZ105]TWC77278.1 hypothetical protein FB593_11617 [Rhizobium sp. SJZ105]
MSNTELFHEDLESIEVDAWHDLYAAAPKEYAVENGLHSRRYENGVALVHERLPSAEFCRIVGVRSLTELERAVAWTRELKSNCFIQVPEKASTQSLRDDLALRGYKQRGNGWSKLRLTNSPSAANFPSALSVVRVSINDADVFGRVVQTAFGLPESTVGWFSSIVGRKNWAAFLAYWDGEPIASGAAYCNDGKAWLGIGATCAEFRKKGAQSALLRARIAHVQALGINVITAETGQPLAGAEDDSPSYSNCIRAGFTPVYRRINYRVDE